MSEKGQCKQVSLTVMQRVTVFLGTEGSPILFSVLGYCMASCSLRVYIYRAIKVAAL